MNDDCTFRQRAFVHVADLSEGLGVSGTLPSGQILRVVMIAPHTAQRRLGEGRCRSVDTIIGREPVSVRGWAKP